MKQPLSLLIAASVTAAVLLSACQPPQSSVTETTAVASKQAATEAEPATADLYAEENRYDIPDEMFEKRGDVDYGTIQKDVTYYSTTAGDNKQFNILLPAGYDENQRYPVMYVFHGFGGSHNNQIDDDAYLTLLYGNMLHEGLAIDDVAVDLMPFVEAHYPVKTGREYTAVAGMSEGGAKSLCTGFKWLDKIGYIASFAPDTNVIAIGENYMDSYWTVPYFKDGFPSPTAENTPYYLYMTVGSKDPWNVEGTLHYRDVLDQMGVKNRTDYVEGFEHNHLFWRQCFYNFLTKDFR